GGLLMSEFDMPKHPYVFCCQFCSYSEDIWLYWRDHSRWRFGGENAGELWPHLTEWQLYLMNNRTCEKCFDGLWGGVRMPWIDKKKPHSCRLPRLRRGTAADAVWMCHRCSERWAVVATGNGR